MPGDKVDSLLPRQEPSPTGQSWLANNYVPCRRRVQEFCPSNHTFMDTDRWFGSPLHREYTTRYSCFRIKRANCIRQHAVFHPEVALLYKERLYNILPGAPITLANLVYRLAYNDDVVAFGGLTTILHR